MPSSFGIHLPSYDSAWQALNKQAFRVYATASWLQAVGYGTSHFFASFGRYVLYGASHFLALFLMGLYAVRVDLVSRLTRRRRYILWALIGALVFWAGFQFLEINLPRWWPAQQQSSPAAWNELRHWWPPRFIVQSFLGLSTVYANAAVYALIFTFAMSFPAAARRLQPLAALGRMTLTTYLVQSVVSTAVFYHWGLGLMTKTNFTGMMMFTVALFSLQIAFSVWWLKRYRFGPAEWLWRSLTYRKRLPLRIGSAAPTTASAAMTA